VAGGNLADLTAGTRQTIGRYFSIVSMVPSLLFVIYVFLLVRSGAWNHSPHWGSALIDLTHVSIGGAVMLIISGALLGLSVHPIQFGLTQFLEGYWGTRFLGRKAREFRIRRHKKQSLLLSRRDVNGDPEATRLVARYPKSQHVMPTRLGNVLRKYELAAGQQYELEVLTVLPHMALAARSEDVDYLDDQRMQLDLAVRMCFTAALACVTSIVLLGHDGYWAFVAVAPAAVAYLSYRGAIISAEEYGVAMSALIDLNRFAFYERFHLPIPKNITEERQNNAKVMELIAANSKLIFIRYESPSSASNSESPTV
jgi:hypothetical protein